MFLGAQENYFRQHFRKQRETGKKWLWLLAGHIAGLAAFLGLQSVVSNKGEKSEVGGAGGQSKWQVTRRLGKKQNGEEPGCLPNPGSHGSGAASP